MVAVTDKTQHLLTMQTAEIVLIRQQFALSTGTAIASTSNSVKMAPHTTHFNSGLRCALVDTSHEKFRQLYLDTLSNLINPAEIDYLIISHTEPDHSGLVKDILQLAPSHSCRVKVALQFLEDMVHQPFKQQIVKMAIA